MGVGAAVTANVPGIALAADLAPPAAIILRMADSTSAMEAMMVKSAEDVEKLTRKERVEAGRPPISRADMAKTIDVMLQASRLATLDNAGDAAATLRGIKTIANVGEGELSSDEFMAMAKQYSRARDELKKVFDALPLNEQAEGRAVMKSVQEEREKLKLARARIAEENSQQLRAESGSDEPPRKKKTLAELEAAQAAFGKNSQPVMSLYAR